MCAPNAGTPNAGQVGQQYSQLESAYAQGAPQQLALQQTYQPQYTNLDLQGMTEFLNGTPTAPGLLSNYSNSVVPAITGAQSTANTATRTANTADLANLGPSTLTAMQNANPGQAALLGSLTNTATNQLALGTQLDPQSVDQINSQVNSNWANRGLGTSNPAQLDAALQYNAGGQSLLASRESTASGVANQQASLYTDPLLSMMGATSTAPTAGLATTSSANTAAASAAPTIFSNADATSLFSGAYNANANSLAANANNSAALCGAGIGAAGSIIGGAVK
jgi:hypothetical protein